MRQYGSTRLGINLICLGNGIRYAVFCGISKWFEISFMCLLRLFVAFFLCIRLAISEIYTMELCNSIVCRKQ